MPELPEVETVARDLQRWVAGATIVGATVHWDRTIRYPQPAERFAAEIEGATIRRASRRAKTVLLHLEDGRVMTVALRMTGALLVTERGTPPDPYVRVSPSPTAASFGIGTCGSSGASGCGRAAACAASVPAAAPGREGSPRARGTTASARYSAAMARSR